MSCTLAEYLKDQIRADDDVEKEKPHTSLWGKLVNANRKDINS